jgi:1-acyl-sn-glycerol-3-phosphate acyltransferase
MSETMRISREHFHRAPGLRPFKLGGFLVATQAGVPLLPVTIRGMRSILRAGQKVPRPGRASISIGAPLIPEGTDWNAAVKLRDHARAEILCAGSRICWKSRKKTLKASCCPIKGPILVASSRSP